VQVLSAQAEAVLAADLLAACGPGLAWGFAELLEGELRSGDSDLGKQSGRGGLVCGHGEGVAAADGWAVKPCCPGRVYGPGAVRARQPGHDWSRRRCTRRSGTNEAERSCLVRVMAGGAAAVARAEFGRDVRGEGGRDLAGALLGPPHGLVRDDGVERRAAPFGHGSPSASCGWWPSPRRGRSLGSTSGLAARP
jgi:hypothetical protein